MNKQRLILELVLLALFIACAFIFAKNTVYIHILLAIGGYQCGKWIVKIGNLVYPR